MFKLFIGGDTSKEKIDFAVFDGTNYLLAQEVKNKKEDLRKFLVKIENLARDPQDKDRKTDLVFAFEYTGIYNNHVVSILHDKGYKVSLIHPGVLKAVVTVDRGKNDVYDSKRIAEYACRFEDKLHFVKVGNEDITLLKTLLKHRQKLVKQMSQLKADQDDNKKFLDKKVINFLHKNTRGVILALQKAIEETEAEIEKIIKQNVELKANYDLVKSVPGIGKITAIALIVYTENFTKFDNAKQLGSYCGVVPFERSSGVFKGKSKVSIKANKSLKTLLHLCALSAIRGKNHFSEYFERKVNEDKKNKMSVLNAVRNKILKTAFSCVQNQQKYDRSFIYGEQAA